MQVMPIDYLGQVEAREVAPLVFVAEGEVIILKPELGVCIVVGI